MPPTIMSTWSELLPAFAMHQRAAGRKHDTVRIYGYRLADVAAAHPRPERITTAHLERMIGTATGEVDKRKQMRAAYRVFFAWARRNGHLPTDPAADLPTISAPANEANPCPDKVIRRVIATAPPRIAFMVLLGAYAGLRCCEIAPVHADDWDGRRLRVVGKGSKVRLVRIVRPELVALLDELDGYAFPNLETGRPIGRGYVSKLLSEALPGRWTAHKLRHRYATTTLDVTTDILAVGNQLGHVHANTTQRYCRVATARLDAVAVAAAA